MLHMKMSVQEVRKSIFSISRYCKIMTRIFNLAQNLVKTWMWLGVNFSVYMVVFYVDNACLNHIKYSFLILQLMSRCYFYFIYRHEASWA